jgi:hypothetical protein
MIQNSDAKWTYQRASEALSRAATDASHLAPRRVETPARPKKFAAPPWIPRLLEGRFHLHVRYTGVLFTACTL